jgi:predicted nucleic-acid-binding Zn-ribbon protein
MKGCIMSEERQCMRCGGTNLEAGEFQSTGKIYSRPKHARLVTLLTTGVPVDTIICLDCGHVELIVDAEKAKSITKAS